MLKSLASRIKKVGRKTWSKSQEYELAHAIEFMTTEHFLSTYRGLTGGDHAMSQGYVPDLMMKEFFNDSPQAWAEFVSHVSGRICLEIGPSVISPLAGWDVAAQRFVVEPLFEPIDRWHRDHLGKSAFEDLKCFGQPGEVLIDDLVGTVDGAIYCRNVLDHSPMWPFILSNIASYAAPGCKLLLWTDLDHHGRADVGHYTIVSDTEAFRRLVHQLGFNFIREFHDEHRFQTNWGCFAVKK